MLRKLAGVVSAIVVAASFAVASAMASEEPSRLSVAKRGHGSKPPVAPPAASPSPPDSPSLPPDTPSFSPPESAPPPDAPPPELPPPPLPPVSPAPTPTSSPADNVEPDEAVRPPLSVPDDAPVRLPQTGDGTRPLTAAAGASLLAAGLAVIAGARPRAPVSQLVSQPVRRR